MFIVPRNTRITGHNCSNLGCHSAALWPQWVSVCSGSDSAPFSGAGTGLPVCSFLLRPFLCPAERWSRDAACVECGGLQCGQGEGQDLGVPVGRGGRKSLPYAEDLQWGEGEGEVDPLQHSLSCHSLRPLACTVPREGHS